MSICDPSNSKMSMQVLLPIINMIKVQTIDVFSNDSSEKQVYYDHRIIIFVLQLSMATSLPHIKTIFLPAIPAHQLY